MSYDIDFRVKVDGLDKYVPVGNCDANITWNVREMIEKATGLEWINEANNGLCKDVVPKIAHGYSELCCFPEKYEKYESPNGWGTVEGCKRFFAEIISAYGELDSELKGVATFWIM